VNFLNDYPTARKYLYLVQWVVNGLFAVLGAYFVAAGYAVDSLPQWYVIPLAVAPVLWTYLGLQAGANTPSNAAPPPYEGPGDRGATNLLYAAGVALLLLAVLLVVLKLLAVVAVSWLVVVVIAVVGVFLLLWGGGGVRL
jgi:hypothetical protein